MTAGRASLFARTGRSSCTLVRAYVALCAPCLTANAVIAHMDSMDPADAVCRAAHKNAHFMNLFTWGCIVGGT